MSKENKTMKPEELMIGDWVIRKGVPKNLCAYMT